MAEAATTGIEGLERIVEPMREPIESYAELVRGIAGGHAKALTLYGPIVTDGFCMERNVAQSVLVLGEVDLGVLRRLSEKGRELGKRKIAAPLIMTPAYIRDSLDTFPLEFIEIQQFRMALFGEDYFGDLAFDAEHVRLQCERELKVVLIGLRQGLLAAAGRDDRIEALELGVGETLLRTLKGALWLEGQRDAKPGPEVVAAAETLLNRKLNGLRTALDPFSTHDFNAFEALYEDVHFLGEMVNAQ